MKSIAIIGGGASGLIASWFASRGNNRVVLFEKQKKLGRKILVTGNGRCNITNRNLDAARYHGHDPEFARGVISRFGLDDTINFFCSMGIPFVEESRGRMYPASLQASVVPEVFEYELTRKGVEIRLHRKIEHIHPQKSGIKLITAGREEFIFDAVILAAGSCAYPPSGASRVGYELAASLGHRIYEPFPAILPLNIPLKALHRLEGIKWNCGVEAMLEGKVIVRSVEELLFTKYGISGPASLEVSRAVNEAVLGGASPEIYIDLFPSYNDERLENLLHGLWSDRGRPLSFSLAGILKKRMPEFVLGIAGISPDIEVSMLDEEKLKVLINALRRIRLLPGDPRSFSEAVVAAGGVDVSEINQGTMESKLVKNLFITGELLDIDGDSGGYNLQFAWSTGALAGMAV